MPTKRYHAKDLRQGRISEAGRIYHVTTATQAREPVFLDFASARGLIDCLRYQEAGANASTLAFVVMPDHLHWLMCLGDGRSLSEVVRAVKAYSARQIGRGIWQAGFHDHALRKEESVAETARYIVANPLRAGLVERVGDYPHWDCIYL